MKAIKRTTPLNAKTVIESITVSATVTFIDYRIGVHRYFPASLTIADADIQFKEWAHNLFKAYPTAPIEIEIKYGNSVWSY